MNIAKELEKEASNSETQMVNSNCSVCAKQIQTSLLREGAHFLIYPKGMNFIGLLPFGQVHSLHITQNWQENSLQNNHYSKIEVNSVKTYHGGKRISRTQQQMQMSSGSLLKKSSSQTVKRFQTNQQFCQKSEVRKPSKNCMCEY